MYHHSWRRALLAAIALVSLVALLARPALPQDQRYHGFADRRSWQGIPNAADVVSNLAFLLAGGVGLIGAWLRPGTGAVVAWRCLFLGTTLVTFGSGWYHWRPEDWTLLWDRLPMTISFMSLFAILLAENVLHPSAERFLLPPLLVLGAASVGYWYLADDLRVYLWVQFFPLLCIPVILLLFPARFTHGWLWVVSLVLYGLAKVTESHDLAIFAATGGFCSGHTLKHLLAGLAVFALVVLHWVRCPSPAAATA